MGSIRRSRSIVVLDKDQEITLAGLKIRAVYLSGHTFGSMGLISSRRRAKKYVAIGDLIMPGGVLGYSGSPDFSAKDALESLRKLQALRPDVVLGGHGGGEPDNFIAKGIATGERPTGWGRMKPEKPDPFFGFAQKNYLIAAWLEPIVAATFGDIDGDGLPDAVVVTRAKANATLQIFLNQGGKFAEAPSARITIPKEVCDTSTKIRLLNFSDPKRPDIVVAGENTAVVLICGGGKLEYRAVPLSVTRGMQWLVGEGKDAKRELIIGHRFVRGYTIAKQNAAGGFQLKNSGEDLSGYFGLELADVNGDGRTDLITSAGEILLRKSDGSFPDEPSIRLSIPAKPQVWKFMACADFNGDGRPGIAIIAHEEKKDLSVYVYHHSGQNGQPYSAEPSVSFAVPKASVLRDGPTAADFNGDGIADLVLTSEDGVVILPGSKQGLDVKNTMRIKLDYRPYHDNRLILADFNGDGKMDIAGWGPSASGAPGAYIWLQTR